MMENFYLAGLLAVLFFFAWNIVLSLNIFKIIGKNKEFFNKQQKGDIYSIINTYLLKMRSIEKQNDSILLEIGRITENYAGCIQKVGVIRYNPFGDVGGDQSFSIALLNKKDSGAVVTSIHGREMNKVFAKPIENKKSEYNLSKEELSAIEIADKNYRREEGIKKNV